MECKEPIDLVWPVFFFFFRFPPRGVIPALVSRSSEVETFETTTLPRNGPRRTAPSREVPGTEDSFPKAECVPRTRNRLNEREAWRARRDEYVESPEP